VNTLIFDCDGVLSDTERYGHLPAFNQTFEEFRLPVRWSEAEYADKLRIGGSKERIASLLTEELVAAEGLPRDAEARASLVARWHRRKTDIYRERVLAGVLPPRPGVRRLVEEALDAGWQLAVASTSSEEAVAAVLEVAVGRHNALRFGAVLAGEIVRRKKPAPDIYELAIERLGADRRRTLVIEDSANGLEAAARAGLTCIITMSEYTVQQRFERAALVLTHLGDPGHPLRVLANRSAAAPDGMLSVLDLEACLPARAVIGRLERVS
jgi:HAD superfamily hydrolase (TIGR01509 family)